MDTRLSTDRLPEERAFIQRYTDTLASRPVNYPADYTPPLDQRPRKVPTISIPLAEPPTAAPAGPSSAATATDPRLELVVKSLKPALTFNVTAAPTDSVADLKRTVSQTSPAAPSVDAQRLLIKGKALADDKLLKEYSIASGATIHLVLKPMSAIASSSPAAAAAAAAPAPASTAIPVPVVAGTTGTAGVKRTPSTDLVRPANAGHHRVPSLTITTDVDERSGSPGIPLSVTDAPPLGPQAQVSSASFHSTIADPLFWQKIHALCVAEFENEGDADQAWEAFLVAMKGRLSAGEAAKIRDVVGVRGMGGA